MDKICDNITIFNDEEEIYMRRLTFVPVVLMGVMLAAALPVSAETLTTADGVLSIEAPSDQWAEVADPNHWFVITDGKNTITVERILRRVVCCRK